MGVDRHGFPHVFPNSDCHIFKDITAEICGGSLLRKQPPDVTENSTLKGVTPTTMLTPGDISHIIQILRSNKPGIQQWSFGNPHNIDQLALRKVEQNLIESTEMRMLRWMTGIKRVEITSSSSSSDTVQGSV